MKPQPKYLVTRVARRGYVKSHYGRSKYSYVRAQRKRVPRHGELPQREQMGNYSWLRMFNFIPLERWLHSQIGQNFDKVYSEYLKRLPPKHKELLRNEIYRFVMKPGRIEFKDGVPYDIQTLRWSRESKRVLRRVYGFYIHPTTNCLCIDK